MNTLLADQYVRNHTEHLLAEAARARLIKQARGRRRHRTAGVAQ